MNMKHIVVKSCLSLSLIALLAISADAQRSGRRRGGGTTPTTNPADTTRPNVQQNNNTAPVNYNPTANIPIVYDTASAQMDNKKSLRNENAFDKSSLTQRTPLPYEHLRWDDALFAE